MPIQICVSIQDDNTLSLLFYFSTYLMPVGYPRSFKPTNNLLGATSVNYSRIETIYIRSHIELLVLQVYYYSSNITPKIYFVLFSNKQTRSELDKD